MNLRDIEKLTIEEKIARFIGEKYPNNHRMSVGSGYPKFNPYGFLSIDVLFEGSVQLFVNANKNQKTYGVVFQLLGNAFEDGKVVAQPLCNRYGDFGLRERYTFSLGSLEPIIAGKIIKEEGQLVTGSISVITHSGSLGVVTNAEEGGYTYEVIRSCSARDNQKRGEYAIGHNRGVPFLLTPQQIQQGTEAFDNEVACGRFEPVRPWVEQLVDLEVGLNLYNGVPNKIVRRVDDPFAMGGNVPVAEEPKEVKKPSKKTVKKYKRAFKVGTEVVIKKGTRFDVKSAVNPTDLTGEVIAVHPSKKDFYNLVRWSNGVENSYKDADLTTK